MKVLQTLGAHGGYQRGVFEYKRTCTGLSIDPRISGVASIHPVTISNTDWTAILTAISTHPGTGDFRIKRSPLPSPPDLESVIRLAAPSPGFGWNDSYIAYVVAILFNEGSVELTHGLVEGGEAVYIPLARDV